jgi:hypothetical protein
VAALGRTRDTLHDTEISPKCLCNNTPETMSQELFFASMILISLANLVVNWKSRK